MSEPPGKKLVFHTFYHDAYEGDSAEEVLRAVHAQLSAVTGLSFEEWWEYQTQLWAHRYELRVPELGSAGAYEELLAILVQVHALEPGRRPRGTVKHS